jgi:hypothetical protein
VLLGAMVAAVAGDQMLDTPATDGPALDTPALDTPATDGGALDTPATDSPDPRDEAARLAEDLLDPIASPQSRDTFATDLIGQLDQDIPGIDHALAGATLRTLGVWLARSAAEVAAPIANSGVLRRKVNQAPAGCGFAGALIAQIGLALG